MRSDIPGNQHLLEHEAQRANFGLRDDRFLPLFCPTCQMASQPGPTPSARNDAVTSHQPNPKSFRTLDLG